MTVYIYKLYVYYREWLRIQLLMRLCKKLAWGVEDKATASAKELCTPSYSVILSAAVYLLCHCGNGRVARD